MPIVKKLRRPCRDCGELFAPKGKHTKLCPKCKGSSLFWEQLEELQKRKEMESKHTFTHRKSKKNGK